MSAAIIFTGHYKTRYHDDSTSYYDYYVPSGFDLIITKCYFLKCQTIAKGGAVCTDNEGVEGFWAEQCIFDECSASNNHASGGALEIVARRINTSRTYFLACSAYYQAAFYFKQNDSGPDSDNPLIQSIEMMTMCRCRANNMMYKIVCSKWYDQFHLESFNCSHNLDGQNDPASTQTEHIEVSLYVSYSQYAQETITNGIMALYDGISYIKRVNFVDIQGWSETQYILKVMNWAHGTFAECAFMQISHQAVYNSNSVILFIECICNIHFTDGIAVIPFYTLDLFFYPGEHCYKTSIEFTTMMARYPPFIVLQLGFFVFSVVL